MEIFIQKIIKGKIENIFLYSMEDCHMKLKHKDTIKDVNSEFELIIYSLHELLFGEFYILIYNKEIKSKLLGVIKLKINLIVNSETNKIFFLIYDSSTLEKADFHNFSNIMGEASIAFKFEEKSLVPTNVSTESFASTVIKLLFPGQSTKIYEVIFDLFMNAHKGSFMCRLYWLFGFISAEYYYNNVYGFCNGKECKGADCQREFCIETFSNLSDPILSRAEKALRYAAASFADSVFTWGIKRSKVQADVVNKRKRAILEMIETKEENLLQDYQGNESSLAYILFITSDNELVISFKGTTSSHEALYDINCEYVPFMDGYAHCGLKTLSDEFIRNRFSQIEKIIEEYNIKKVMISGHSLGGAAAVLVTMRLIENGFDKKFSIEAFAFGSPPTVAFSIASKNFPNIKSFIFDSDIISRLSYGSMLDLKYLCISISSIFDFFSEKEVVCNKFEEIKKYLKETNLYPKLYHPGELYFIKEFNLDGKIEYKFKKVKKEFFEDIVCNRKAPFDHFMYKTMNAFLYHKNEKKDGD